MISAKFSNLSKISGAAVLTATLFLAAFPAAAQNQPGYTPPPMFDDMTPPMVRPAAPNGYIVEPKKSGNTILPPSMNSPGRAPIVLPRVSVDPNAPQAAPAMKPDKPPVVPAAPVQPVTPKTVVAPTAPAPAATPAPAKPEMMKPIVEEVYIRRDKPAAKPKVEKEAAKPVIAAPVPPKKPAGPVRDVDAAPAVTTVTKDAVVEEERTTPIAKAKPAARDPKESAIQGPKTMPALPTENVDGQVLFENKEKASEPTIFERQQQSKKAALVPVVPRPKDGVEPATFDKGEQGALKKTIPYEAGQISLPDNITDPIAAGVVGQLDEEDKKDWRVQIKSYATPHGTGLSSDRRIALSRALSLRSSLITQGVSASRIDVLAEGLQTEGGKPGDRIDLYLYGPSED